MTTYGPATTGRAGAAGGDADPSVAAPSDERELVAAVLNKDRKATAELVSRYADAVYSYVRFRLAPRRDLVEDFVQETFLSALEQLHTFAGQGTLRNWLVGIARHKVEDYYRMRLREPEPTADFAANLAVAFPEIDALIDKARLKEKTRRVLGKMPESRSIVLLWRYWEQRSAKEMAEQTGKTEKAIERLLARARAQFKDLWDQE